MLNEIRQFLDALQHAIYKLLAVRYVAQYNSKPSR